MATTSSNGLRKSSSACAYGYCSASALLIRRARRLSPSRDSPDARGRRSAGPGVALPGAAAAGLGGHGGRLTAFDVAEVAQHAHAAVGVLDQEFVAPVLEGEHPAAGFDHEGRVRRCARRRRCGAGRRRTRRPRGRAGRRVPRGGWPDRRWRRSAPAGAPAGSPWWGRCGLRPREPRRPGFPPPPRLPGALRLRSLPGPRAAAGGSRGRLRAGGRRGRRPARTGLFGGGRCRRCGRGRHDAGDLGFRGAETGAGAAAWRGAAGGPRPGVAAAGPARRQARRCAAASGARAAPRTHRRAGRACGAADWPPGVMRFAQPATGLVPASLAASVSLALLRRLGGAGLADGRPQTRGPQRGPGFPRGPGNHRRSTGSGGASTVAAKSPSAPTRASSRLGTNAPGDGQEEERDGEGRHHGARTGPPTGSRSGSSFRG